MLAMNTPSMPPMRKFATKPMQNRRGASKRMTPPHIVMIQLKIFTPVGTPMIIVMIMKNMRILVSVPVANMWCIHTVNPSNAIARIE